MTPAAEARIRAAGQALIDELIAAMHEDAGAGGPDRLLSIDDARKRLGGMSRSGFYGLLSRGGIRTVTAGRRRLVPESAIEAFAQTGEAQ